MKGRVQLASHKIKHETSLAQVQLKLSGGEILGNEQLRKLNRFYLTKIEGKTGIQTNRNKEYSEAVLYFTFRRESGYYVLQVSTHYCLAACSWVLCFRLVLTTALELATVCICCLNVAAHFNKFNHSKSMLCALISRFLDHISKLINLVF